MNQSQKTLGIVGFSFLVVMVMILGLGNALMPLLIAFVLAYQSFPVIRHLESKGVSRNYAVLSVFMLVAISSGLTAFFALPSLIKDIRLFFHEFPRSSAVAIEKIEQLAGSFGIELEISKQGIKDILTEHVSNISGNVMKSSSQFMTGIFSSLMSVLLVVLNASLIPLFYFHLVNRYEFISKQTFELVPIPWRAKVSQYMELSNIVLKGYVRGQVLVAAILAVLYITGFLIIGLRFGFLIGLVSGILIIIPYVGSIFGFIVAMIVALANFTGLGTIIGVATVFIVVQALESLIITPKLVGNKVGLGVLSTILALIIGGNLFGISGMIVAIPVTAILQSILRELRSEYQTLPFYKGRDSNDLLL